MTEESNSLNPYDLRFDQDSALKYNFTTDSGELYSVYFTDASDYFETYPDFNKNIISFGLSSVGPKIFPLSSNFRKNSRQDSRIRDTVCVAISQILNAFPHMAILTICDTSDGKHVARNRLFDEWYKSVSQTTSIRFSKYNMKICGPDNDCAYLSMMIHEDNRLHENIKNAFFDLETDLISKGY